MQFTLSINQAKAKEWGLNAQQALLFSFVYSVPSWANSVVKDDGSVFYAISKQKIVEELPLLTDKPDTAYRMLKQLASKDVIELSSTGAITLVRITDIGKQWNKKSDGSEKYPSTDKGRKNIRSGSEKFPIRVGKISEEGSEKYPTNHDTNNHDTNHDTSNQVAPEANAPAAGSNVVEFQPVKPRVDIPDDMPGPKDQSKKTFRPWANYAFAYRNRYGEWPIWNARTAGQFSQLVDRVGAELAPAVAAHYVQSNNQFYLTKGHSVGPMLNDCETLATQARTGRGMTNAKARQLDSTQTNYDNAAESERLLDAVFDAEGWE